MRRLIVFLLGGLFLFSTSLSWADRPNYNYAQASYFLGEVDLSNTGVSGIGDIDQDGFQLNVSGALIDDQLWLFAAYGQTDGDDDFFVTVPGVGSGNVNFDIEVDTFELGVGWIFGINDTTTVDVSAKYREDDADLKLSGVGGSVTLDGDADGFGVAVGIRSNVTEQIELFGRAGILEGDYEGGVSFELGGVINFNEQFAITASYEQLEIDDDGDDVGADITGFRLGARLKF